MERIAAVQKLCHSSDEWFISKGALGVTASMEEDGCCYVSLFPCVREVVGGKSCGKRVFSNFFIEVRKLRRVFDRPPAIRYDSGVKGLPPCLYLRGKIDGQRLVVCILPRPPADAPAAEQVHEGGEVVKFTLPHIDEVAKRETSG